jgi:formylglycine-generating enzyme required for sulfatase activity
VIALVHTHKGRLPEARAVLYEEAVDILLWRWEQVKLGGQEGTPLLRQLLLEAGRSEVDLKRVLWELAYEAQASSQLDDDESLADIGELRLQKALAGLKDGDHNWARQVVAAIKLRAGLLLERSPEVFSFPHRTFQEYLAGAHLAAQANFASNATELTLQGVQWREVILLAVGRLVYLTGDMDKPLALVGELCPAQPGEDEIAWQRAWLAADVLAEMGVNRVKDSALGRDLLERVRMRLVDLLSQGKLSVIERAHAGDTLAALGDPRFDPETWYLPDEPMFGFVEIPAGPFLMGSDPLIDPDAYDDEQPQQDVNLLAYYIARYPVTKAQFRAFVDDSGYQPRDQDSLRGLSNHPVVYVSWHDALAYCEWLNKKLREKAQQFLALGMADENQRLFWEGLVNGELRVTLPSEAEWEKAARGTSASIYPWGAQIDAERANYGQTGIGGTSAVGCFPGGASPYGVQDLSGNVREWTHSLFKPYPYNPEDGREELESDDPRVLRGGAFLSHHWHVRCAYRYRHYPDLRNVGFGFCVVVSPSQL